MKSFITKFAYSFGILAFFGFGFFSVATSAQAFVSFNNDPQDYATLRAINSSDNPGSTNWISTTVNADKGETVTFDIYYHNTGTETAQDVRLSISPQGTGSVENNSFTFTASIDADNYSGLSDSVGVSISSDQSMAYIPGTAKWYPNQTNNGQSISDSDLFGSGISVGNIAPGWSSQGHLHVQYLISSGKIPADETLSVATNSALDITESDALLRGTIDAGDFDVDNCWFEWSDDENNLDETEDVSCSINSGNSEIFESTISGLSDDTEYFFKACAQDDDGNEDCGSIENFSTDAGNSGSSDFSVDTLSAEDVDENSATLRGEVNAGNDDVTDCWFNWGEDDNDLNETENVSCSINSDDSETVTETITDLNDDTEYFYEFCADDGSDEDCGSIKSFTTDEDGGNSDDFDVTTDSATSVDENSATLNGQVDAGDFDVDNCWFEWGNDDSVSDLDETENVSCSINSDDSEDFSENISGLNDDTEYFYRACAEDDDSEEQCGSIKSFTTDEDGGNDPSDISDVIISTTPASSVTQTSARLNAVLLNNSNDSVTGWFEWGQTSGLGSVTSQQSLGTQDSVTFFNTITNLTSNTTYYFRAVGRAEDGSLNYGQILSFRTLSITVPQAPVIISTGVVAGTSTGNGLIMLTIDSRYENVYIGDTIDYTVTYKNISGRELDDAILRVFFPAEIGFRNASKGFYSESERALTIELGTLERNETDTFYIQAVVQPSATTGDLLVTTANLVYTNPSGAQEEAIAYELNNVSPRNALLGLALFGGAGFLPDSLLEWLLLILIILALVYITRKFYNRREMNDPVPFGR